MKIKKNSILISILGGFVWIIIPYLFGIKTASSFAGFILFLPWFLYLMVAYAVFQLEDSTRVPPFPTPSFADHIIGTILWNLPPMIIVAIIIFLIINFWKKIIIFLYRALQMGIPIDGS